MKENKLSIIAGTARGRKLISPEGTETRPTSNIVKESMMNIIQFELSGARILDLYAGSGQLGLEALSRGASHATFVDENAAAVKTIKDNILALDFSGITEVVRSSTENFLKAMDKEYDIAFIDPPYNKNIFEELLPLMCEKMHPRGIIICESERDAVLPKSFLNYRLKKDYKYGKRKITAYRGVD